MQALAFTSLYDGSLVQGVWYNVESKEVLGCIMVELCDNSDVYAVKLVAAQKGLGLEMYEYAMMGLHLEANWLTSSGDETNEGSASVWARIENLKKAEDKMLDFEHECDLPKYNSKGERLDLGWVDRAYTMVPNRSFYDLCDNQLTHGVKGEELDELINNAYGRAWAATQTGEFK